ncbi:MAG: InlB B-repeat-containing protein [Chitinivibrionia bacterium]|nr:InlB B-repeat-containing protein [Chitinivibrionia bacterium]
MKKLDFVKMISAALVVGILAVFALLFVAGCGDDKQDTWDNGSYGGGNYEYKQNKPLTFSGTIRANDGTQRTINGTLEKGKYSTEQWAINMGWSADYQGQAQTLEIESVGDFPKEILDGFDNGAGAPVGVTFMVRSLDRFNDEGATPIASFYPSSRGVRGDFSEVEISDAELLCLADKFTEAFEAAAVAAGLSDCPIVLNVAYEEDIAVVSGYMRTVTFTQGLLNAYYGKVSERTGTLIKLPAPIRDSYTFNGWFNAATGGERIGGGGDDYMITGDVTMYAYFTANKYTLTFESMSLSCDVTSPQTTYWEDMEITLPTPTCENSTFKYWYSKGKIYRAGDKYTVVENATLYALWNNAIEYYEINFYSDNGTVIVHSIVEEEGKTITLPTYSRDGYTFNGWYSAATGGTKYGGGEDNYTVTDDDIAMYMRWTLNNYTLTFNSQGGSGVSPITQGFATNVTLPNPTRSGYVFDGWYSAATGGTKYNSPYTVEDKNVTMYAQWLTTITFNSQGGGSVQSISRTSGTSVTLPAPTSTREHYIFDGWYSAATGGIKYNSPYTITAPVTMYARYKEGPTYSETKTINGIECVLVKAGTFAMGQPTPKGVIIYDGQRQHDVTLTQDFWISKYEITQAQYRSVMGNNPSRFSGRDNNPVENVSWGNADTFARNKGGRLPTEAEWEFAARGGNRSKGYIYSGSNTLGDVAWYESNSSETTKPVGQKKANELGIYDMTGNVIEWCSDWYSWYPTVAVTNPTGAATGVERVVRGGGWNTHLPSSYEVAQRSKYEPTISQYFICIGFRVVFPRN